jgi:UDP-N-acetylglucosamine--N-acetylmuramyl-(pentapeptide) pyrophosphoryl-undecaprenol N-acetylglucosamine transferase
MKILIVAGGTGGHLYPGLAVARALSGHEVCFVVRRGDLGMDILRQENFPVKEISGQGLPRSFSLKGLSFPYFFLRGWVEAAALLKQVRPDWVVGMGGYLSVPVIVLARFMKIKTLLHEQNVVPGLANRLLSRFADSVALSFPASKSYFSGNKVWVSGLPVRPGMGLVDAISARQKLGLEQQCLTFFVFGGSLGALRLNTLAVEAWPLLQAKGLKFQVLHVTGTKDFQRVEGLYRRLGLAAKILPYCHEMPEAYAAADAVICRAGASTIAELLAVERPAFLVPYPYASNNHQVENAEVIEKNNLGRFVLEKDLKPDRIADFLAEVVTPERKSDFERAVRRAAKNLNPRDAAARLAQRLDGSIIMPGA